MAEIHFKATRRLHDSGYRMMDKSGNLEYDLADTSYDVIWLTITEPSSIKIDCQKDGTYRILFEEDKAYLHSPSVSQPNKKGKDE